MRQTARSLRRVTPRYVPRPDDATALQTAFEDAGRILARMPGKGLRPADTGSSWPPFVREVMQAYGYDEARPRSATASNREIEQMGEVYAWVGLLPHHRYVLRRILQLRSQIDPASDRHRYSWRHIARIVGCNAVSARRWHGDALRLVLVALHEH